MKFILRQNIIILLAIFIMMASFGVQLGMNSFSSGAPSPCQFNSGMATLCPMGVVNHISFWKQIFSALPGQLLALIVIAALAVSFSFKALIKTIAARLIVWYYYYKRKSRLEKIHNYFNTLFAKGILHPKIYA
ncbi:MAG: hypothetical protein AAB956_00390 [Patescibacteria group bacterium]